MRSQITLHEALFTKEKNQAWQQVALPHTWNAMDGQDGGSDYDRGEYHYQIALPNPTKGKRQFIEFEGANHVATVWCNDTLIGKHAGGFSTFRFELTECLQETNNTLLVSVDNSESEIYPQQADFTFFGGLYRPVHWIETEQTHFDLMQCGTNGIFVTPQGENLRVDAFITDPQSGDAVVCEILDREDVVLTVQADAQSHTVLEGVLENPHLWNGLQDPFCYIAKLTLVRANTVLDEVRVCFGIRTFSVNSEQGFILNQKPYALHGVSRHQDRLDMGWALTEKEHREDLDLISEVGANSIRLAHYQHSQYFYDLCDQAGMVLWAEIPFISVFLQGKTARENTMSQMRELIAQNYNHPSICFWGISNEITIGGDSPELVENLKALNELTKKMDPSRLTTMAQVSMLEMESEHNQITDVLSYNHYFGWYGGDVSENGAWLDKFHEKYPNRALGVSEYGAEAILTWHSAKPDVQDYTEEYQAYYHEEMLKIFAQRPYLWSTYVWNMFDFAADARDEGGCKGRNNKGLVTYDRKIKKDSFYIYRAFWTKDPFVHICGRRFVDRAPDERDIKVYSNCPKVALYVNGQKVAEQTGDKIFLFRNIALQAGENEITAKAVNAQDDMILLNATEKSNPDYVLPEETDLGSGAANWFDDIQVSGKLEFPQGYFSIKDKIGEIMENPEGAAVLEKMFSSLGSGASNNSLKNMMGMLNNMSVETILRMAGKRVPPDVKYVINDLLTQIKK